jgi:hypothetical protein
MVEHQSSVCEAECCDLMERYCCGSVDSYKQIVNLSNKSIAKGDAVYIDHDTAIVVNLLL